MDHALRALFSLRKFDKLHADVKPRIDERHNYQELRKYKTDYIPLFITSHYKHTEPECALLVVPYVKFVTSIFADNYASIMRALEILKQES